MLEIILALLFALLAVHALLDFPLQGDTLAVNKNPDANTELQKHVPWYYWLGAHAFIHGGGVALVTGSVWLGLAETFAHFWIDLCKCKKFFNIHVDQLLHVVCKVVWVLVYIYVL